MSEEQVEKEPVPEVPPFHTEESWKTKLAKLEAEEEDAARAEYEKRMASRKAAVPFDAARGAPDHGIRTYDPADERIVQDLKNPQRAFDPEVMGEFMKHARQNQDYFWRWKKGKVR
jgi:hypothetical protein